MNVMTWIVRALQIILLGVAVFTQSFYMLDYAAVCLRLGIFRLVFAMLASLDEEMQKRKCRFSGLCMFPSDVCIACLSAAQLISQTETAPVP